jgi:4-hydroxy-tetrahydrodipicolinate synthase
MPPKTLICRSATTFANTGGIDEEALRRHLQRLVDARLGVYLGSGASGEGHALTWEELRQVYRTGVEVGRGKIIVASNQPEQNTARDTLAHAKLAIDAGVDLVNLYGPEGRHGYRATDEEYTAYFDHVLPQLKHPVALAPNPQIGYLPKASIVADICNRHTQVTTLNFAGIATDAYFIEVRAALRRDVDTYVPYVGSLNTLGLGATGLLGAEANVLPRTFRRYLDLCESDSVEELAAVYAALRRFSQIVAEWSSGSPRWIKMALRVFRLPGGEGGVRKPYLMPDDHAADRFTRSVLALGLPEIDEMARSAGLV